MAVVLLSGTRNASSWAMRAWLALTEAGVDFNEVVVDIRRPQRYAMLGRVRELSPPGQVPVLIVDGQLVFDSLAIMEFANDVSGGRLLPSDAVRRAQARALVAWQHAGLSNLCGRVTFESAFYPYKANLSLAEQRECGPVLRWLESLLRTSSGPFLFGDVSLADLSLAPTIIRLVRHGLDLTGHPRGAEWMCAVMARDAVRIWMNDADGLPHVWLHDDYVPAGQEQSLQPTVPAATSVRL